MGRSSLKSKEPISLPHDGPLYYYFYSQQDKSFEDTEAQQNEDKTSEIIQAALHCLKENITSENETPTVSLIATLKNATQVKEQLHALQAYRSTILHRRKQPSSRSTLPPEDLYRRALYRILLEWSLSLQTPLPLRRAIQSNLDVLAEEGLEDLENIQINVLTSIFGQSVWQQPLHSLHEALNWHTSHDVLVLKESCVLENLQSLVVYATKELQPVLETVNAGDKQSVNDGAIFVESKVTTTIQLGIQWVGIVKTILADAPSMAISTANNRNRFVEDNNDTCQLLVSTQNLIWTLLTCQFTPVDALSNMGIAYSRALFLVHSPTSPGESVVYQLDRVLAQALPPLTTIAVVQGMAATVPIEIMLLECNAFRTFFQEQSNQANPEVRLAALKGIHTLVSRCLTKVTTSSDESSISLKSYETAAIHEMTQGTLETALQAWESPPNRRLGNAIPSLFQKLVSLMLEMGGDQDSTESFQNLVLRLLAQPSNRKGRYKALETLLPIVGSRQMISLGGWKLMESLLEGVGDRNSHNAGAIADLWANILSDLLQQMVRDASPNTDPRDTKSTTKDPSTGIEALASELQKVFPEWLDTWVPSLVSMLLSTTPTRRKQVAAFCLPRIVDMVGGRTTHKAVASFAFAKVLNAVIDSASLTEGQLLGNEYGASASSISDDIRNRALWAALEVRSFRNYD